MAHVLLPCDMPSWNDIQRNLSHLRLARNPEELISGMQKLHAMCSVHLDPEESIDSSDTRRFELFKHYLTELLSEEMRIKFFKIILPNLINNAVRLKILKPLNGFHFSLQQEEKVITLDRKFIASLIANSFFSTFPKRTPKTHPTLQDFNFGDFFMHLERTEQQEKLRHFLLYFELIEADELKGNLRFYRQVLRPPLSLPSWMCSERPLCPLLVRTSGRIGDSESHLYKTCFVSSKIGEDVLKNGSNMESLTFCRMPELIATLSFVEALSENEALIVEGVIQISDKNASTGKPTFEEVELCLMDAKNFSKHTKRQYEDINLLREINKAFIAFNQPLSRCRPLPVGQSASSSTCPEQRSHSESPPIVPVQDISSMIASEMINLHEIINEKQFMTKVPCEPVKFMKLPTKSSQSSSIRSERNHNKHVSIPSTSSTTSQPECYVDAANVLTGRTLSASSTSTTQRPLGFIRTEFQGTSGSTFRRQRSRSLGALPTEFFIEDEYFTASESFDEYEYGIWKIKQRKSKGSTKRGLSDNSLRQFSDESRYSRSDSTGFVLDGASDEESQYLSKHERYEDFRSRIRRRCRRLSKKGSRSSWLSSSGSSDMEDIMEDSEISAGSLRQSNSEPSLLKLAADDTVFLPPVCLPVDTVSLSVGKKKMMVTTSNGQLKAYSYDGVKPNLPVPFKAKFRTRRSSDKSEEEMFHSVREPVIWKQSSSEDGSLKDVKDIDQCFEWKTPTSLSETTEKSSKDLLVPNSDGVRPVVTSNWGCGQQCGDIQLKAIIQWLAASMATLPCLIFYTSGESQLKRFEKVIKRCQKMDWKLGDLACETLRYCRNRFAGRSNNGRPTSIFTQLLAGDTFLSQDSLE